MRTLCALSLTLLVVSQDCEDCGDEVPSMMLLQTHQMESIKDAKRDGKEDRALRKGQTLNMAYVPYNFGHTVSEKVLQYGIRWGDCGSRVPVADCVGWQTQDFPPCDLMYVPGKLWTQDKAKSFFGNSTIFGILRDPYERMVAQFRGTYRLEHPEFGCDVDAGVKKMMEDYLAAVESGEPWANNCNWLPQAEYFDQPFGATIAVDNRKFPDSMNELFQQYGYDIQILTEEVAHVAGCDTKWAADLSPETKALVYKVYHRDFELLCKHFGYCDFTENVCLTRVPEMRSEYATEVIAAVAVSLGAAFKFGTSPENATVKAFGSQECPCIGFAGVDGTAMVHVGEHYVAYPGELGSRCAAWDDDRHPESCREGQTPGKGKGWCKQPWCYVDPRKCDLEVAPKLSEYVPTARYQNMPLFYSYSTCGGEEPASDAMQPGCECIGIENKAGSIKANLDGVPVRYPGEVGGSCKAWDLERNPLCAVKGVKPSFCTQKWCYVDPCKCGVKAPPKEAVYFNATMRGKTIYYSYEACGYNDTFTLGYNKNACISAKDEKACGLLPKCAWSGSSCFGKELVVPELCSADQVYNGTKVEDLRSFSSWSRPALALGLLAFQFS